jgi:putative nucleotidyltransferase with HDIG domain
MLAVSAAMAYYARQLGEDPEFWAIIGLLHDFDWEIHPNLNEHPTKGSAILRAEGWDEETIRVILSHYTEGTGVERQKPVDYALLACDEITGLIIAATLVKPSRNIADVDVQTIRKKWKDRRFAAGVDREDVPVAVADFSCECFDGQLELWVHIENVLKAMQASAADLDLDGRLAS